MATALMWFVFVSTWLIFVEGERWAGISILIVTLIVAFAFIAWVLFPSIRVSTDSAGVIRKLTVL